MKTSRSILLLVLGLVLALALSACASMQRQSLINSYVDQQITAYEYSTNFAQLWAEARSLLFNRGYQVRDSGNGYVVETEWVGTNAGYLRRYLVTGYPLENGRSRIQFDYNERSNDSNSYSRSGRDLEIEAELIQRLEPQSWQNINSQAVAYADANMPKD